MSTNRQYCTFYLSDMYFGIPVECVQEIIRYQDITRVALAPSLIRGLINLRGQIVTAIELRDVMSLPERDGDELPMNIIVGSQAGYFSLLVDRIGDVLNLPIEDAESPPNNLEGTAADLIEHAYKLENDLLLALNVDRMLNHGILGGLTKAA